MAGASRIWKFVKSNLLEEYQLGLLGLSLRFLTSFELRAVDRGACCHLSSRLGPPAPQSLLHNFRRHRSLSRRRLARGCLPLYLCTAWWASIYRSTCLCFLRLACFRWLRLLYTAAILLAATSWPHVNWFEKVVGHAAQDFGDASVSRTFSDINMISQVMTRARNKWLQQ